MQEGETEEGPGQWSVYCSLRALRAGSSGGLVDLFEDYLTRLLELGVAGVTVGECEGARIAERYSRRIRGLQSQFWKDDVLISAREENAWLQREKPTHVLYAYPFYHNLYSCHSGVEGWQEWTRTIVCIPDVQHLTLPEYFCATERKDRDELFNEALEHATTVFTISDTSSKALRRAYGACRDKPPVVWPYRKGGGRGRVGAGKHILYPANDWQHKNHQLLLQAWLLLCADGAEIPLILTGSRGQLTPPLRERIRANGLQGMVEDKAYVGREELDHLVENARCLVFPSLFEGFGMPILEAMEKGVPVICSRLPVFEEVAGEAAAYFHPEDADELARVVREVWTDTSRRDRMVALGRARARRYTPERTEAALEEVFRWKKSDDAKSNRSGWEGWQLVLPKGRSLMKGKEADLARIVRRWPATDLFLLDAAVDEKGEAQDHLRQWNDPDVYHSSRFLWLPTAGAVGGERIAAAGDLEVADLAMRVEMQGGVVRVFKGHWCEGQTESLAAWRRAIDARWRWVGEGWAERTAEWVWEKLIEKHAAGQPWVHLMFRIWRRLLRRGPLSRTLAGSLLGASLPWLVPEDTSE